MTTSYQEIERLLRAVYDFEHFLCTKLYSAIIEWENSNNIYILDRKILKVAWVIFCEPPKLTTKWLLSTTTSGCNLPHFACFPSICTEECKHGNFKKVRKTVQFTAFQEEKYNDKNTICLPRQYLPVNSCPKFFHPSGEHPWSCRPVCHWQLCTKQRRNRQSTPQRNCQ